jgi:hypothetical protein
MHKIPRILNHNRILHSNLLTITAIITPVDGKKYIIHKKSKRNYLIKDIDENNNEGGKDRASKTTNKLYIKSS